MNRFAKFAAAALLLSATQAIDANPNRGQFLNGKTLRVGSPAPALKVAKWVKGTPVNKFAKGKVYVVEFWATWCGPCIQSIPHLTEMAKQFKGKVTFCGINIWESHDPKSTAYMQNVQAFVKEAGHHMDYNVAIDGPSATVAKSWMDAAGKNSIPTAFIVDKKGKIAWIGHPMDNLNEALKATLAKK